jgi:hypothetical protein
MSEERKYLTAVECGDAFRKQILGKKSKTNNTILAEGQNSPAPLLDCFLPIATMLLSYKSFSIFDLKPLIAPCSQDNKQIEALWDSWIKFLIKQDKITTNKISIYDYVQYFPTGA